VEADEKLSAYLAGVAKSARQFKLLALHGAMEAARAGAQTEGQGTVDKGHGAEFRVVALEVRRLAMELASATEEMGRTVDGARRSLLALHGAAAEGTRRIDAAQSAMALGVTALDHATTATSARRSDDAALAEAGTELTILTSAIRERATGSAKGTGDVADRLALLEQLLGGTDGTARQVEQSLAAVEASVVRARETVAAMMMVAPVAPPAGERPQRAPRKKRAKDVRRPISSTVPQT
jgi:methyl-accepting chemotaxis protein